jgi:hypothetical protein
MTVPAEFTGFHTFPIHSRGFRQWFFDQSFSDYETIPTAHAFSAILRHLDTQAARDPFTRNIRVPYRIDSRGHSPTPEKILLDLANPAGEFVEITPNGWQVTSGEGVPFETSSSACSLPAPEPAGGLDPQGDSPLDILRSGPCRRPAGRAALSARHGHKDASAARPARSARKHQDRRRMEPPGHSTITPFERSRRAADAARDNIWQGNCDVASQTARSNDAELCITNPSEIPNRQLPCQIRAASFKRLYRKVTRRSGLVSVRQESAPGHSRWSPSVFRSPGMTAAEA